MNGAHDAGGMMGFGPVMPEPQEPVFHARWQARMFALMSAVGDIGGWSIDEDRAACEAMEPGAYLTSSYYEHWLHGLERLLAVHGLASPAEIERGRALAPGRPASPTRAGAVWPAVTAPGSYRREPPGSALFRPGQRVRARNLHPATHTRLPRYVRGRTGEIVAVHGAHVFPDSNALRRGEDPQWLYGVRFTAAELWGRDAPESVSLDLWEPYLEAC